MTNIINVLEGATWTSFVTNFFNLLTWILNTVLGIFTGISSIIAQATANITTITGVFTSNSGVFSMINDVWGAVPAAFKAIAILSVIMSAVLVMVRRA